MANSKANIYPIQLQGAELNLNKYDAEIKQYSGFNKNNAPYVGGCLANVFTKDETQEGSTPENTYIDTNGDVYRVDTSGLWKNEEKVLNTQGSSFYEVEEVNLPKDTIHVLNKDVYITYENQRIYLYWNGRKRDIVTDYNSNKDSETPGSIYNPIISGNIYNLSVNCYKYSLSNKDYYFVIANLNNSSSATTETSHICVLYQRGGNIPFEVVKSWGYNGYTQDSIPKLNRQPVLKYNPSTNYFYCFFNINDGDTNYNTIYGVYGTPSGSITKVNVNVNGYTNLSTSIYFADDYATMPMTKEVRLVYSCSGNTVTIELNKRITTSVGAIPPDSIFTSYNESFSILKSWGFSWACKIVGDGVFFSKDIWLGVTGNYYHNYSSYDDAEQCCINKVGDVIKDSILINNNYASGICLPKTFVLVTDWNTVDVNYIFFTPENSDYGITYKNINNEKWYKVKKGSPKLKYINGQIVINADVIYNSYKIKDGKSLLYAPAWNNRRVCINDNISNNNSESQLFASAINEYELADNSSIIINPVSIRAKIATTKEKTLDSSLTVNYYMGETDCLYAGSSLVGDVLKNYTQPYLSFVPQVYVYPDKKDLPFPADANGNVQYSPSLFSEIKSVYGNEMFIKNGNTFYPLMKSNNNEPVMSFFLASGLDNLEEGFIVQGQFYGIINNGLYSIQYSNGVLSDVAFVVDVTGLKFCGNTPYQAFFFSKTNRCLYSFTGANVMNQAQFLDKFEDVIGYKYNPATQTIFMITANEVIAYSSFGTYEIYFPNCKEIYLLENGACLTDNEGNFRYIKYYAEEGYTKQNITLETCFYGMNNQTVTINDCLYVRLFSEEHESGNVEMTASTLSNSGRMTEKTTFKIKSTDWDKMTHTVYLRYQPKEQRGLGASFSINSPFKIAALSVGSVPDTILVDKISKGAINAPEQTSNNVEW